MVHSRRAMSVAANNRYRKIGFSPSYPDPRETAKTWLAELLQHPLLTTSFQTAHSCLSSSQGSCSSSWMQTSVKSEKKFQQTLSLKCYYLIIMAWTDFRLRIYLPHCRVFHRISHGFLHISCRQRNTR
jgi:hypothetical protein